MHTLHRALLALALLAAPLRAQVLSQANVCAGGALTTRLPGSLVDENTRARSIRARAPWSLTRGAADDAKARMLADSSPAPVRVAAVLPELLVTSQRSFPLPANDGPMWAGKGLSYSVTAGVAVCGKNARWGAIIAPTYWYAENANFPLASNPEVVPPLRPDYSPWASPYHYMPRSLDAPRRFGDRALRQIEPGVLSFWYRAPRVEVGFTTEPEWWGPGQNNALLLSSQAAGVPRAYVRTTRPIRAKGDLELRYFLGGLSFSPFFFRDMEDSIRTLSGIAAVWRPAFEPNLSIGAARLVAAPMLGNKWFTHIVDPLVHVGTPNALPYDDKTQRAGRDQLFSLFANWRLPDDGTEVWMEWARAELPMSIRDFVESPNHTQALTIGLQHVRPLPWRDWTWRVGAEFSQTNQSSTYRERPTGSWYTSRAVQGGFTEKGQVLGAMIGPGSVAQRLNMDFASARYSAGIFAYRIRWDDDAYYTIPRPIGNGLCKHDVSLALGGRAAALTGAGWLETTVSSQRRMNLYYETIGFCFDPKQLRSDKHSVSVEFRFLPRRK